MDGLLIFLGIVDRGCVKNGISDWSHSVVDQFFEILVFLNKSIIQTPSMLSLYNTEPSGSPAINMVMFYYSELDYS